MVKPTGIHKEVDAEHGRVEERVCRVYRDLSFISASWHWPKLSALVDVERRSFNKKAQEESIEKRYFITNLPRGEVARIAHAIRSHWVVENGLHWTLDVVFDEDRSRKRVGNAVENYSRLMRVVMSLLKRNRQRPGFDKPPGARANTLESCHIGLIPLKNDQKTVQPTDKVYGLTCGGGEQPNRQEPAD